MRDRFFRATALLIGVLGIPSLIWQVWQTWDIGGAMTQLKLYFFAGQVVVLSIFVSFGLGIGPMAPRYQSNKPNLSNGDDSIAP
ncbi:hypothetical protein [Singulisphaera acidiphila]|uniref:Uncharacterized protein n=1 Tax=Singulisphaera acidiphila (strain ATCC BAA-1392 / DSM 18658 / VKM B-2454 / MOB10) TaxID=886293 RepID=L0DGE2_SINAD|nr:hypothetical protein [Singulisphaera acidiphila]AGA28347.1 hypothetical protein Sinac_4137 [Singulisphaera acidiphila DSM 18658]